MHSFKIARRRSRTQRGVVLVWMLVSLTAICGVAALAVDCAAWYECKCEAQRVADCSAIVYAYWASTSGSSSTALSNMNYALTQQGTYDPNDTTNNYVTNPYKGNSAWYNIHIAQKAPEMFGALFTSAPVISASATAIGNDAPSTGNYPPGAIVANGPIDMPGTVSTSPGPGAPANWTADVWSNGAVTLGGSVSIDKYIHVSDAMLNGTSPYLQSSSNSSVDPYTATSTTPSAFIPIDPISFPDSSTQTMWSNFWQNNAVAGQSMNANTINNNGSTLTITGPTYIKGNVKLGGNAVLDFERNPSISGIQVVFINGSLDTTGGGTIINDGVVIVATGNISMGGSGYALYTGQTGGTGTISDTTYRESALISTTGSISLSGGSNTNVGFVDSLTSSVSDNGNGAIIGELVSGGTATDKLNGTVAVQYPDVSGPPNIFPSYTGLIATSSTGLD